MIRLDANVLFDFDSLDVDHDGKAMLVRVASLLSALDYPEAQVGGHTDQIGSTAYNLDLSQRRADAVRSALGDSGVQSASLTAQGYGESRPLRDEIRPDGSDDPAARQLNRRVEILLVDG